MFTTSQPLLTENEIAMRGSGYYNKNSALQHVAALSAVELFPDLSHSKSRSHISLVMAVRVAQDTSPTGTGTCERMYLKMPQARSIISQAQTDASCFELSLPVRLC